jgi:nuclear pore complex protein Nup98-Nup96
LTNNPYGDNELFKNLKPVAPSESAFKATNPLAQKALLESSNNFKVSPNNSALKIKLKPVTSVITKKCLFDGLEEYDASLDENFKLKSSAKRLIIKPRASMGKMNDSNSGDAMSSVIKLNEKENDAPEQFRNQISLQPLSEQDQDTDRRVSWLRTAPSQAIRGRPKLRDSVADTTINQFTQQQSSNNRDTELTREQQQQQQDTSGTANMSLLNETFNSSDDMRSEADQSILLPAPSEPHLTGITLNRVGYYTIPSLDELIAYMDSEGRCVVPNFTIGRRGYGNVYFDEEIDVSGLNLDDICHFRFKEIILYQDDETKPPVGTELNRKAQVTLDQLWPNDKQTHEVIKDPVRLELMGYEAKLRRICEKRNARFLEYRPETGSCVFKVDHFSKYTLSDSDDEGGEQDGEPRADPKKAKVMPLVADKGKKIENGKNGSPAEAMKENFLRSKQHEASFVLGPHMGQRGAGFTSCEL